MFGTYVVPGVGDTLLAPQLSLPPSTTTPAEGIAASSLDSTELDDDPTTPTMIRFGTPPRRRTTPTTRVTEELHTIVVASHTIQAILERSSDTCLQYVQVQAYATTPGHRNSYDAVSDTRFELGPPPS